MRILYQCLLLLLMGCMLPGCGTTQPTAEINIQSARYLNPDINGNPAAVVVSVFQLKSPFSFKNAGYDALDINSAAILGADLIDKQVFNIRPHNRKSIKLTLEQSTQYIGIVAGYRKINEATWHTIIRIPKGAKSVTIELVLESQGLSARLLQKKQSAFLSMLSH